VVAGYSASILLVQDVRKELQQVFKFIFLRITFHCTAASETAKNYCNRCKFYYSKRVSEIKTEGKSVVDLTCIFNLLSWKKLREKVNFSRRVIRMKKFTVGLLFLFFCGILFIITCEDDKSPADARIKVQGTAAFSDKSASYEMLFKDTEDSAVSGTLTYDGSNYTIAGTFVDASGAISATAAGTPNFTIVGTYTTEAGFSGTITRDSDSEVGTITGGNTSNASAVFNCLGTFGSGGSNSNLGTWNFTVADGTFTGTFAGTFDGKIVGTATETTMTVTAFYWWNGSAYVASTSTATVTGTFSGDSVNGTWELDGSGITGSGDFTGTRQ